MSIAGGGENVQRSESWVVHLLPLGEPQNASTSRGQLGSRPIGIGLEVLSRAGRSVARGRSFAVCRIYSLASPAPSATLGPPGEARLEPSQKSKKI